MYDLSINELWDHGIEKQWLERLDSYWNMKSVRDNLSIEREMDCIHNDLQQIIDMDDEQFYEFLYQKYFVWKYTAKNRLTTTRNKLETQTHDSLSMIKDSMFALYEYIRNDTELLMMNVMRIKGLEK